MSKTLTTPTPVTPEITELTISELAARIAHAIIHSSIATPITRTVTDLLAEYGIVLLIGNTVLATAVNDAVTTALAEAGDILSTEHGNNIITFTVRRVVPDLLGLRPATAGTVTLTAIT